MTHFADWLVSNYREIQSPPRRYRIIDMSALHDALGLTTDSNTGVVHREWVEEALKQDQSQRDARWSESVGVGSQMFVEGVQEQLGTRTQARQVDASDHAACLREESAAYIAGFGPEKAPLSTSQTSQKR